MIFIKSTCRDRTLHDRWSSWSSSSHRVEWTGLCGKVPDRWSSSHRVKWSGLCESPWSLIIKSSWSSHRVDVIRTLRKSVITDHRERRQVIASTDLDSAKSMIADRVRIVVALNDTESDYWRVVEVTLIELHVKIVFSWDCWLHCVE